MVKSVSIVCAPHSHTSIIEIEKLTFACIHAGSSDMAQRCARPFAMLDSGLRECSCRYEMRYCWPVTLQGLSLQRENKSRITACTISQTCAPTGPTPKPTQPGRDRRR